MLAICDRFKKLPDEVLQHDSAILRYLTIEALARREEDPE